MQYIRGVLAHAHSVIMGIPALLDMPTTRNEVTRFSRLVTFVVLPFG